MSARSRSLGEPSSLLSELVSIASPSGHEGPAADWVQARCERAGLSCQRLGASVVVRCGKRGGARLLYASHLDTVPVGTGWRGDPLDPAWSRGRLVARGANDAKASAVAMLWAAAELERAAELEGELLVALTACEETTNAGMADVLASLGAPDAAVVGEPTGLEVVRAQAGLAVLTATWTGRACHAAHAARVAHENALLAAARELAGLPRVLEIGRAHPLLGSSTLVATLLASGERHNVVPDRAAATFDARLAQPVDAAACLRVLAGRLPGARLAVRSERLKPVETAVDHPLVTSALALVGSPHAIGSSTLSDMALLSGVPAIKCGPGASERSHTPDEFVLASELAAGCAFYRALAPRVLPLLRTVEVHA
jgi:acetylornithine deacetylase